MLPFPGLALSVTDIRRSQSFLRYHTPGFKLCPSPHSSILILSVLSIRSSHFQSYCRPCLPLSLVLFLRMHPLLDHVPGVCCLSSHEVVEAKSVLSGYRNLLDYSPSGFLYLSACLSASVCLCCQLAVWL